MKTRLQLLSVPRNVHPSILVEQTKEKFGYDPRFLKDSSSKIVIKRFDCCGVTAERNFRAASTQHSCQRCANKKRSIDNAEIRSGKMREWYKTHVHPRLGSHLSKEAKERIGIANKGRVVSLETRLKISSANIGKPCPQKALDYWKDPSHLGVNHHLYGSKPNHSYKVWYNKEDGKRICFRSTWEARVARYFDSCKIDWEYELSTFPIYYFWNGKKKSSTYRPDFWLPLEKKFIEVKGLWREEYSIKYLTFKEQYPNVCIDLWDKEVLKLKGIRTGHIKIGEFNEAELRRNC